MIFPIFFNFKTGNAYFQQFVWVQKRHINQLTNIILLRKFNLNCMRKTLVKNPFQFSDVNSYLWNQQGKKHFWGVHGKDYGLIQSPQKRHSKPQQQILPEIKLEHISCNPFLPRIPIKSEKSHFRQAYQHQNQLRMEQKNFRQYESQRPVHQVHCQTEPVQQILPRQLSQVNHTKSDRKPHLSLLTKNVSVNLQERDSLQIQRQKVLNRDFSMNKRANNNNIQMHEQKQHETRERIKSEMNNYHPNQLRDREYRDRVVRVVRRDRRNSPTFCNSLAYPLPCYRYIQ